jgi:hypothetical protein
MLDADSVQNLVNLSRPLTRSLLLQWKDELQQLQAADAEDLQQNEAAASTAAVAAGI